MSTISAEALPRTEPVTAAVGALARARERLASIDILRGFVIVLMALDHVRDYFTNVAFDPLDLSQTTPALFMTRWITNLCAPTFIFLAGMSAYLMAQRMELRALQRFLITRGLWLIVLEITVVHFAWSFNLRYDGGVFLQVIWAIGASMIILAGLVRWPLWAIAGLSMFVIAGHNLLDGIAPESFGPHAWLWSVLHVQSETPFGLVLYPIIPWFAVMALGYCAGTLFDLDKDWRARILIAVGVAALALFALLRAGNAYGDPHPWTAQSTPLLTLLAFIDVHKYPPSLMYLLVTLGIGCLLLALFEHMRGRLVEVLQIFGRVPLFVYVAHIVVAHLAAGLLALAMGLGPKLLTNIFFVKPDGWGFGLLGVYLAWLGVLLALYPACHWFAQIKRRRKGWWLSYL